jgi:hypothetical protein
MADRTFASEADMVARWLERLAANDRDKKWTVYPETAGWDLLLVHRDAYQLGIEAKLSLNAKVIAQALAGSNNYWCKDGPDYRAVLVPADKVQLHLGPIARALGLGILTVRPPERGVIYGMNLPDEDGRTGARRSAVPCPTISPMSRPAIRLRSS